MTNNLKSFAQTPTQTIRGIVYDGESNFPLTGATVLLMKDSAVVKGNYSDENGNYRFDEIAVGRYSLHITYVGYMDGFVRDIILSSGKTMRSAQRASAMVALATFIGVLSVTLARPAVKYALPLSAGVTLYIAASDLIPEVNHNGWRASVMVFAGVALFYVTHLLLHAALG